MLDVADSTDHALIQMMPWLMRFVVGGSSATRLTLRQLRVLFTLGTVEAQSSSKVYRFKRLDSDVSVQPNGDLQIVETQEYQYVQGSFTFGFRDIPTARLDRITNIGVSDDTRKYQPTDSTGIPFSFTTFTTDNGDLDCRLCHECASPGVSISTAFPSVDRDVSPDQGRYIL